MEGCNYLFKNKIRCNKETFHHNKCALHADNGASIKSGYHRAFKKQALKLLRAKDGNWQGVNFPRAIKLKNVTFDYDLDFSDVKFSHVNVENSSFKSVTLTSSIFRNGIQLSCCDFISVKANCTTVRTNVYLLNIICSELFDLSESQVEAPFYMSGKLEGLTRFSETIFKDKVTFASYKLAIMNATEMHMAATVSSGVAGTRQRTFKEELLYNFNSFKGWLKRSFKRFRSLVNKKATQLKGQVKKSTKNLTRRFKYERRGVTETHLFYGRTSFYSVIFEKPSMTKFSHVNLATTSFSYVDFKDITFIGCNWYQKKLGRNGAAIELRHDSYDYYYRKTFLPIVETECRKLRHVMEDNKNYSLANDFFIGEMEAKRKQLGLLKRHLFSLLSWYRALSIYGTSPYQCLKLILLTVILHSSLIFALTVNPATVVVPKTAPHEQVSEIVAGTSKHLIYSLQVMTLRKDRILDLEEHGDSVESLDFAASLLGPVLTLILGLSIRTRIKRS